MKTVAREEAEFLLTGAINFLEVDPNDAYVSTHVFTRVGLRQFGLAEEVLQPGLAVSRSNRSVAVSVAPHPLNSIDHDSLTQCRTRLALGELILVEEVLQYCLAVTRRHVAFTVPVAPDEVESDRCW